MTVSVQTQTGATTCVAQADSQYPTDPTGLTLMQALYNATSATWLIDLAYAKGSQDTVAVLYLPRVMRDATSAAYSAQFNATFQPANFPCSTSDQTQKASTTCCLNDFANQYRPISTLILPGSLACSPPYTNPPALVSSDAIYGRFGPDMPKSSVAALPAAPGQLPAINRIRVFLDSSELRTAASLFSGTVGVSEQYQTFIGLATLTPTGSRILDSSTQQINLNLFKSDLFTVTASGTDAYTFLSYVNVRVNQVLDGLDPSKMSQYAAVSFVLAAGVLPNTNTGLIPPTSVRVGKGPSKAQAVFSNACQGTIPTAFSSRLAQSCGPAVGMCLPSPAVTVSSRFVSINIPLMAADGSALFNTSDPSTSSVFLQFTVSVLDETGASIITTIDAAVAVMQGGVATWCYGLTAKSQSQDMIDGVDILVGSAASPADFTRLTRLSGLQSTADTAGRINSATQNISARSIESGLLTLVVRGKDSVFGGGLAAPQLTVDDVVTLHIMGDSLYTAVAGILAGPNQPFQVVYDQTRGLASMSPSPALAALCGPTANQLPLASCVLRYDVQALVSNPSALDVGSASAAAASSFMQGIVGSSDFAAALGANFSALLKAQYQLSPQTNYRSAFWINPGYTWIGQSATGKGLFTLSQRVVVVALISVAAPNGGSRRRLLAVSSTAPATSSATINFDVGIEDLVAEQLNLPADHVSTWSITLKLTPAQICLSADELRGTAQSMLVHFLTSVASPIKGVYISDSAVNLAGTVCPVGRRQLANAVASGRFETIIAFQAGTVTPYLDVTLLSSMPGVLLVQPIRVKSAILANQAEAASMGSTMSHVSADSGAGKIVIGVLSAVGVLLCFAGAMLVILRRQAAKANTYPAKVDQAVHECDSTAESKAIDRNGSSSTRRRSTQSSLKAAV